MKDLQRGFNFTTCVTLKFSSDYSVGRKGYGGRASYSCRTPKINSDQQKYMVDLTNPSAGSATGILIKLIGTGSSNNQENKMYMNLEIGGVISSKSSISDSSYTYRNNGKCNYYANEEAIQSIEDCKKAAKSLFGFTNDPENAAVSMNGCFIRHNTLYFRKGPDQNKNQVLF